MTALHSCSTDSTTLIALMLERKCVFFFSAWMEMLFVFCFPFSLYVKVKFLFLTKRGRVFYFQLCNSEIREITFLWGWEFDNFELPWCGTIYHYKKRHQRIVIIVNMKPVCYISNLEWEPVVECQNLSIRFLFHLD